MAIDDKLLAVMLERAASARQKAYVPYSHYMVGAAILTSGGDIYEGANVENAVYRGTHAEKLALDKAVMEGARGFVAIAVITDDPNPKYPCAQCLQDLTEFDTDGTGSLEIIAFNPAGYVRRSTLGALLPERFGPKDLGIDVTKY